MITVETKNALFAASSWISVKLSQKDPGLPRGRYRVIEPGQSYSPHNLTSVHMGSGRSPESFYILRETKPVLEVDLTGGVYKLDDTGGKSLVGNVTDFSALQFLKTLQV